MNKDNKKPPPNRKIPVKRHPYAQLQMELQKMVKENDKKDAAVSRKPNSSNTSKTTLKSTSSEQQHKSNSDKMKQAKDSKPVKDYKEPEYEDPDVPNRTYGDLYCKTCDSHMNSEAMWEAHISGKRHIKNVKKGDSDSKYDVLDVESALVPALKDVKEPIVGLSYVQETRRREPNVPSCFSCFLCHSSLATPPLVIEHLISKKHRLNYIKEHQPSEYELIAGINLRKGAIEPLVYEAARKLEDKFTRGTVIVKIEKPKRVVSTYGKRSTEFDDDEDDYKRPKFPRSEPKEPSTWKSVDTARKQSAREFETQPKRVVTYHPDEDDFKRRRDSPEPRYESRYHRDYSPKDFLREDYSREEKYMRERDYSPENPRCYEKSDSKYPRSYELEATRNEDVYSKAKYEKSDNKYPRSYELNEDVYSKPRKNYPKSNDSSLASEQYHPLPSTFQPSAATALPHEKPSVTAPSEPFELKDFVQRVFALPAETFLKIAIHKMDSMDLKEIDELSLLCKLMNKIRDLICSKLPPEMQNLIKQKMNDVAQPAPAVPLQATPISPAENIYKPAMPQEKAPDLSFIRDILSSANISITPGPLQQSSSHQNASASHNSLQNSVASLFGNRNLNQFHDQNPNTFSSPTKVESQTMHQGQDRNPNTFAAPNAVEPRTMYQNQDRNPNAYSAPNAVETRTMHQNQINQTQVDRSAAYSTSAYVNSTDSPSAYYNSSQAVKPSVNIPGLTLAEDEPTESQLYSNYKRNCPSSDGRQNYPSANADGRQNYPSANVDVRQNYPSANARQNYPSANVDVKQNYPPANADGRPKNYPFRY